MDKLSHPLARGASWLLIYLTAVQPLHPAIAAGITAANGNTQVVMKPGNVPVVNIATPNPAGISHNTYQDFNVGTPGAVLNNATQGGKTQLGVTIDNGNARLKGKPAELIINEVTSGNRSELKGRLEVFGNKAGVMIANPNGITCDGCGFINTPSVTLTTGKPQFDKQGALEALEVKKGAVIIGGNGLNGASTEYVDVISRATELNGKINAKTLTLTQGANRVSFKDGTIKPIAGEGAKPQLAVDTKALGGMYAGKIRLVATEAGVGVNLSNIDSQQRDIALSVNGKMTLSGKNHSKTDMNVSAQELRVLSGTTAQADGSMTLATTRLSNSGALTTSGDMRIFSESVRNNDEKSRLHANKSMWIQKDAQGDVSTVVENLGGTIKTNTGDMVIRTRKLNNNAPYTRATRAASIEGGASVYINADILETHQSNLKAVRSLILTGQRLTHWEDTAAPAAQGKIQAGDDVVADFSENIEILTMTPHRAVHGADAIIGRNILLRGGAVYNHASLSAGKDLTVMAHQAGFYSADVNQGRLRAGGNLSLISNGGVDASQTELYGKNIDIVAREGDVLLTTPAQGRLHRRMPEGQTYTPVDSRNYAADGSRILTILSAGQDISLYGLDVTVHDVLISRARNFSAHARESLSVGQTSAAWQMDAARLKPTGTQTTDDLRRMLVNRQMERLDRLETTGDMTLYGLRGLYLDGQRISAGGNLTLTSGQDIRLDTRNISGLDKTLLPVTRYGELWASAVAGGNLQLSAGRDILLKGTQLSAKNRLTLMAGHDINADSLMWTAVTNPGEWHRDERQRGVLLQGDRGVSLSASGALSVTGGRLESRGDITLTSRGDMRMASARTRFNDGKTERYGHTGTEISSGGNLTLLSAGSILFQASRLLAGGAIDVAAEGGYLYAQAMEEVYRWEETSKKCNSFLGIKSCKVFGSQTKVQTKERSTNKVTEFVAPGNISLLARNNVMLEASRVEAGKNARIISHNGSVIFRAVKNTAYEREVTNGKGFFITQGDRGYYRQNFMLPGIWAGGKLTVEAATGITADIKVKNGQTLQQAIDGLSQEPGGKWIKHINQGNNTQWSVVKDAYDSWDYHSQSLNPAVAAVIAIAASAATAGSGLAIAAANSFGGGVMSAGVMGGMQALAAQAAVALVEHQGNLSKTLKTLGSNGTVRAVVSNMLISGALQGFDEQLKLSQATPGNPVAAKLPTLDYTRWSDVTTRVAGQSLISNGVNTAIYGGSFREKLTTALLSNVAGQIQAEGAGLIGDNGKVLGLPGKVLSHAVVAGINAEIGRGNVRGAAVGALAAELSAITLGDIFIEPATRDTRIQSAGRIIGAITGAAVTNSSGGAISGANAAENVLRYNFLMHDEPSKMARKLAGCKGNSQCETGVRKEMAQLSAQNEMKFDSCRKSGNAACIDDMLSGISGASGYRELGSQIGFDISREYELMGQNAYTKFSICGWESGVGCGLKLWANESLPDALILGLGLGAGKLLKPVVSDYISEVVALSRKGGTQKLIDAANKPINSQGLSSAARAWEKHAGREVGIFEPLKGNVSQKNEAANQFVKEVLQNKNTVRTELSKGGVEYRLQDGRGIRYNSDGSFSGFLNPKRP